MAQWGLLAALGLPSARQAQSLSQTGFVPANTQSPLATQSQFTQPQLLPSNVPTGGVPRSVADYSMRLAEQYGPGSPQQAAYIHAYHLYGGNEEYARRAAANPDAYFAMFPGSGVGSAGGSSGVPGRAGSVGAAAPAPPQGQVDIFNPGPYLAQQLLSQRPGYVFGTRVPRPGQITLADWQQMLPAQRSALLGFYSALGIPPEDAVAEMIRFWLTPQPISSVRYLY